MFNIKSKVLAAAAVLTLLGGIGTAGALTAGTARAATPSCGAACINIFPRVYSGTSLGAPQNVIDVLRQGERVGQPVILFRSANYDPAEDWALAFQGDVADFYEAGLVSAEVALHYGCGGTVVPAIQCTSPSGTDDQAFEIEYSPFGVESGLCMAVAATAFSGEGVTLQGCGQSSRSVWIEDTIDSPVTPYYAAINGSDDNFSDPFVLTYPSDANPVDKPRAQVVVTNLDKFASGPTDNDNQLWTGIPGELP
jgi:hypothetical protein